MRPFEDRVESFVKQYERTEYEEQMGAVSGEVASNARGIRKYYVDNGRRNGAREWEIRELIRARANGLSFGIQEGQWELTVDTARYEARLLLQACSAWDQIAAFSHLVARLKDYKSSLDNDW